MRNIFVCMVVALMCLAFAGCGGEQTKQTGQNVNNPAGTPETSSTAVGKSAQVQIEDSDQNKAGSVSVATDKSVKLPKGYPSDKFPVYEGSDIYSAIEVDGSYTLTAYSKEEVKKVIAFYETVLADAQHIMDTKTDESLTSMGTKAGYAYTMDVGKSNEQGYLTTIAISVQPAN